ncbi:MFS transporter, partial [Desulfovibrio sp.]
MLPTLPENEKKQTLFSRDFILLFCMAMCNNSYMAVFYCFEQWLEGLQVSPNWRGILLSALFAMVLLWRPLASIVLLSRSKLPALLVTICLSSCIMLAYPFIHGPDSIWLILGLRIAQGISLAVYSSCVVAVLVSCIPKGQSARGFAIFSLTTLLPYSIIPAVGEQILPLLGGEPRLFALMAVLAIPALCMLVPLAPKLRKPEISADTAKNQMTPRAILYSMTHSGLGCIYLACLSFS